MSTKAKGGAQAQPQERRKFKRRQIIDSFSMFVALPKKGGARLALHDVSEQGIGFAFDTEGETHADSPITQGDTFSVHLYLNQSLYLPLTVRTARIEPGAIRRVGAEFVDTKTPAFEALQAFVQFLDKLENVQ